MGSTSASFAQADGTIRLETYARPQWAYDRSGAWVEADPTLVVDEQAGTIGTTATVLDVTVSPGGSGPFVTGTAGVGSLSLSWPDALPPPTLSGATATYADVFVGVDLQVTAGVDWFSYRLVVHTPEAAAALPNGGAPVQVSADGLALAQAGDGPVVATDPGGEPVFGLSGAIMWDSSEPAPVPALTDSPGGDVPGAEPGRLVEVDVELDGDELRVVPDATMLADPATVFPVTIDPTFTASRLAWTVVGNGEYADDTYWDDAVWPRIDGLKMGYQGWVEPFSVWRTLARFDTSAARGSTVNSADVRLTVYHTGGCDGPFPLQVWQTEPITQGAVPTSWNTTRNGWLDGPLATAQVPSANSVGDVCTPDRTGT